MAEMEQAVPRSGRKKTLKATQRSGSNRLETWYHSYLFPPHPERNRKTRAHCVDG